MDIKPPKITSLLATRTIHELELKINQQLEVKVISTKNDAQTFFLQAQASLSSKPIQVKTNLPLEIKQGETLQLLVTRLLPALEFELLKTHVALKQLNTEQIDKLLQQDKLVLKQFFPKTETQKQPENSKPPSPSTPLLISAKIIAIDADQIQLKVPGQQIITINKEQLEQPASKQQRVEIQNFKVGQTIQLEVSGKSNINPDFKLIDSNTPKLVVGQHFAAKVIEIKNNTIQLQLQQNNMPSSLPVTHKKIDNPSSVIILNKNQLLPPTIQASSKQDLMLTAHSLKPGQLIQFEVIKSGLRPEFKLLNSPVNSDPVNQQVLNTIKQALPVQLPIPEFINQLVTNLPRINNNETISDNLKRLAREILDTLPQIKDAKNPKQIKTAITQSGLFLESKLVQSTDDTKADFQADFKNKLLKFQHVLKQELEIKTSQKAQSNDLNLIKEMQQKTESSLARIILNQLTSLPKEEGARQMWMLDLPFLNKETAESVKVEIDRENNGKDDNREENWSVTLTITPPGLATIHCKISCIDKTINTRFWSNAQETVTKITQNLDYLETHFKAAGLETGHLSSHKGTEVKDSHQIISNQNLFDQKV